MTSSQNSARFACVLVAALGYFVDVYDLLLFSTLRQPSLKDLGLSGDALLNEGVLLLNMQMAGMLIGGILFGIWGDRQGRVSVLFGSITLYSIANIFNGFVQSVDAYAVCRLMAGIGLAGELGAGVTLVNETLSKETRGYGVTIVATVGVSGAIAAAVVGDLFPWRTSYFIGGGLGLALLVLRILVHESGMFSKLTSRSDIRRGDLRLLFSSNDRIKRYLHCILVGLPIWYIVGILVTFSPELGKALEVTTIPKPGNAIIACYLGFVLGDLGSGLLSQYLKSRKRAMSIFLLLVTIGLALYFTAHGVSLSYFYTVCTLLGFGGGYWALFVTSASEQFGTNLRATVTTTVPNFVRGSTVLLTLCFNSWKGSVGVLSSALYVGLMCIVVAVLSLNRLKESFHNDLDFIEE